MYGKIRPLLYASLSIFTFSAGAVEKGPRPVPMTQDLQAQERFESALELHQLGVDGDEEAVIAAQEILEELLERNPDDARVKAFLGNLYVLRARDAIFYRKMKWLRKGESTLDGAVAAAPEDPSVRSVRAVNSYMLPRIFGRRDLAEEDFGLLISWAQNDPDRFDDDLLRFVYFHAGCFYGKRDGEKGLALLESALATPGSSVSEDQIRAEIEELR